MVGADTLGVFYPPSGDYPNYSGAAVWIGQVQEITFDQNEGREPTRYIGGGDRNLDSFLQRTTDYSGRIRYYPQDGKMFAFCVGSISTAAGSVHTISETGGRVYWGGLELYNGTPNATTGLLRKLNGVNFDRLRIRGRQGEAIEAEIDYAAGSISNAVAGTKPSVTAATAVPFMWDDTQIKISGAAWNDTIHSITEFEWELNNNLEHPYYLDNTRFKGESIPAEREYSVDLTMYMVQTTGASLYDSYYFGGSQFNMEIALARTSGTDQIRLICSGCKMTAMEVPLPIEGPVEQTCTMIPQSCSFIITDNQTYPNWSLAK